MSYRLDLSFKNCKSQDVYKNICEFQNLLLKNAVKYIKDNLIFVRINEDKDRFYNNEQVDKFIATLFKHHIWYCEEIQALCIVWGSNVKEINDWFDGYVYFQNSTDQDYDYETWEFNEKFKSIREYIQNMSREDFVKKYNELKPFYWQEDEDVPEDIDYHRKSAVYELCERIINPVWTDGFGITFIDGALDQNKFNLRNMAIKMIIDGDPELKECFTRVGDKK